jgi:hypothetical protein
MSKQEEETDLLREQVTELMEQVRVLLVALGEAQARAAGMPVPVPVPYPQPAPYPTYPWTTFWSYML